MQNDKYVMFGCGCNRGNEKEIMEVKTKEHFLNVVWSYSLSLTSTVSYIANRENGLQSLSPHFGKVSVSKKSILGHWRGNALFIDPYGHG